MGNPVVKSATFKCSHSGIGLIPSASSEFAVDSDPIVTKAEFESMSGLSTLCTNKPPPAGKTPCTSVIVTAGVSAKLQKAGNGVVLDNGTFVTDSAPTSGTVSVSNNQTKLTTDE